MKKKICINGVFDYIHRGHCNLFKWSKSLNNSDNYLVVGINSDDSVRKLNKGPERPIHSQEDRKFVLECIRYIDKVVIFDQETAVNFLMMERPDILVKSADRTLESMNQMERRFIESYNGEIVFAPFIEGFSTTNILKKLQGSKKESGLSNFWLTFLGKFRKVFLRTIKLL